MKYSLINLPNGLPLLTVPMPALESATLTIWVKTGSRNEDRKNMGISHFLEHMAFKGGRKYKTAEEVSHAVDAIGGEFNAGTSKEWTNFYIKTRADKIETAFDVLSDMLIYPALRDADIAREKGVIVEEMNMYEDNPLYKIGDVFENCIYAGHILGEDTIGTKETVTALKRTDFTNYIQSCYVTNNMLVTIAGGITPSRARALAQKYFSGIKKGKSVKFSTFTNKQKKPQILLKYKKTDQTHLIVGFFGLQLGHKDRFTEAVLSAILGSGMSSRLFTEIREKRGLAYSVHTSTDHYVDTGSFSTYSGLITAKTMEAIEVILSEHYAIANQTKKISVKELEKAKEYLKGHLSLSLEDTRAVNSFFALRHLFGQDLLTPAQIFAKIDRVTTRDVYKLAKALFVPAKLNLALIGPFKSKEEFEKIVLK